MSRHYQELTGPEIIEAQKLDEQIARWAQIDYDADVGMGAIYKEIKEKIKKLLKTEDPDEIRALWANNKQDLPRLMELMKPYFKVNYGVNWEADHYDELIQRFNSIKAKGIEAQEHVYELNKQYTGWRRFWLVPGGHLHDNYNCSTCHKMGRVTQMLWSYDLSGLSLETAVDQYGKIICTVCYPEAPTEWTMEVHGQREKEESRCSGSGKPDPSAEINYRRRTNYGTCPDCNGRFVISKNTGLLRAHAPWIDPYCEGSGQPASSLVDNDYRGICPVCNRKKYIRGTNNIIERHNKPKVKAE